MTAELNVIVFRCGDLDATARKDEPWAMFVLAACEGDERLMTKVSFGSSSGSPRTSTVTFFEVSPGAKVSGPEVEP